MRVGGQGTQPSARLKAPARSHIYRLTDTIRHAWLARHAAPPLRAQGQWRMSVPSPAHTGRCTGPRVLSTPTPTPTPHHPHPHMGSLNAPLPHPPQTPTPNSCGAPPFPSGHLPVLLVLGLRTARSPLLSHFRSNRILSGSPPGTCLPTRRATGCSTWPWRGSSCSRWSRSRWGCGLTVCKLCVRVMGCGL